MRKLDWMRDEMHHFPVAMQARVVAIAERAFAEGAGDGHDPVEDGPEVPGAPGATLADMDDALRRSYMAPERHDEPPVSIEVGQVMPALPPTLEELPRDGEPEPSP